jgi:hypothetical protein
MLQLSVEQMRASSGQQNANFGIRSEAQSGVGIQRLKAQGEIATFHFPDNLARALRYEAKVILDLIPKIYDTKRVIRILGLDGKETSALLDPEMGDAYREEVQGDVDAAFNPMVGRYDVAIDTGPSYQTQRQEAADALTSLTQSMPNLSAVAGDLVVKSYDFPMADEISERLARALPPGLREDKSTPEMTPEHQQVMQQMNQQIDQLTQELHQSVDKVNELQDEKEMKLMELRVKAYEADTKRISAVSSGMTEEQIQALIMQAIQSSIQTPGLGPELQEEVQEMEQEEMQEPQEQQMQMPQQPMDAMQPMDPGMAPPQAPQIPQ